MANEIWVIAEQTESGQVTESSLEALAAALHVSEKTGQTLCSVMLLGIDAPTQALEMQLSQHGAKQVVMLQHEQLAVYQSEMVVAALAGFFKMQQPSLILAPASQLVKDFLPRLTVALGAGIAPDAIELQVEDGLIKAIRPTYGENMRATVTFKHGILPIISLRAKAYAKRQSDVSQPVNAQTIAPDLSSVSAGLKVLSVDKSATKTGKKLEEAEIIVSGGRGLKGPENFAMVEALAEAVGGATGATRAVVDAGWRAHSEQVGQTGKTVSPQLYFALGISGAIQHQVGMSSSRIIIAVNKDADAPIFDIADFGIVGDVFEVVPALTQAIKDQHLVLTV